MKQNSIIFKLCESIKKMDFIGGVITIDFFDEGPFFEACEDGSTEEIVGISGL